MQKPKPAFIKKAKVAKTSKKRRNGSFVILYFSVTRDALRVTRYALRVTCYDLTDKQKNTTFGVQTPTTTSKASTSKSESALGMC